MAKIIRIFKALILATLITAGLIFSLVLLCVLKWIALLLIVYGMAFFLVYERN